MINHMTDSFLLFLPQARLDQYLYKDITFWHIHIYVRWVILLYTSSHCILTLYTRQVSLVIYFYPLIFHSQLLLCLWIQISLSASRGLTPRRVWWVQQSRTGVLKKGIVSKCSIVAILSMVNYCTRDGSTVENLKWRCTVNFVKQ